MTDFTAEDYARLRLEAEKRKLELYRPYRKQQMFHRNAGKFRETLLRAGNQCLSPWSIMETDSGERLCGDIFFEEGANVPSWDGESRCTAQISRGILRGIEPAFRVVLESGRWFDCSTSHQILTEHGYCRIDQLMSRSNGLHLSHKLEDYQASCVAYGYLDGQLPLLVEDSDQDALPSQAGAPKHSLMFSHEDAEEQIRQYTNFFQESDLHSTFVCGRLQREALYEMFSCPRMRSVFLPLKHGHENNLQLLADFSHELRSSGESCLVDAEVFSRLRQRGGYSETGDSSVLSSLVGQGAVQFLDAHSLARSFAESNYDARRISMFYPLESPVLVFGEKIIAYIPIGWQPIIDCHVPVNNNYILQGVIHHNCGKTMCAAANTAIHATGKYPSWWEGVRLKKAPVIWCAGVTGEVVRDSIQKLLIGDSGNPGTGFIPLDDIVETTPSRGVADLVDTIYVKHASGGKTRIRLKYYEQGREKFQADTVDIVWLDEEPPLDIYTEALTRTNATKGFLYMTFTPLKGMSEVVRKFLHDKSPDRCDINMTIEDALHIAPAERQKIIDSYPAHERNARIMGQPILGSGRIFPVAEEAIACDPFDMASVPFFWLEIAGIDFGWEHPTAAVKLLYNPQDDIIYVTNCYKRSEATPIIHAAALKPWGKLPWAWPHDGNIHDKNSGEQLSVSYRDLGLNMLPEHATFENGSNSVEAGLTEMLMRMETGRFRVFRHLSEWFEEFRLYHRKEGKVQKEYDDLMACTRYAIMQLRSASRVRKVAGMINGYPIEEDNAARNMHQVEYNPLSREICRGIKG